MQSAFSSVSVRHPTFTCHVCGAVETKRGPNQKCCERCRHQRWLQYYRDYQRQRPKRGKRTIGDPHPCEKCGRTFAIKTSGNKFCSTCSTPRPVVKVALGQTFACANCSDVVVKTFRRQSYCAVCYKLRERNSLPSYKAHKNAGHSRRYQSDVAYRARRNATALRGQKIKYATDPAFAINVRMRTAIGASIEGMKDGRRWELLVGYTLAQLMTHLEKQFLAGMSWANRAQWHIDHIIPLSSFKFTAAEEPEFKAAWALTNLRPLSDEDNRRKWATRLHLI